jgi:xanthine dehydrogenase iron-sulfur cluster and FAD-binding subunit A
MHDARREMTWEEYYVDVERRARRKGGFVMWLNPPRPVRPTSGSPPPGIVHHGAPLSNSVR